MGAKAQPQPVASRCFVQVQEEEDMQASGWCSGPRVGGVVASLSLAAAACGQQFQDQTLAPFHRFPAQTEYTSQSTIGDLDGDGDLDLAFANGQGFGCPVTAQKLRLYMNNGAGFFTDETDLRTGGLTFRGRGVELGDIERDGDLDIIVAQDCSQIPALLVNDGGGFFTNQTAARLPALALSSSRGQFGDLDNDGDLDLYFCNGGTSRFGTGPNKVYLNDGSGVFTDATAAAHPGGASVAQPMDVTLGDIDGDFDLDVRVGSRGGGGKLYRNEGHGVFSDISAGVPADFSTYSYDFGDINGDGDLDLLGANSGPSNSELLLGNDGTGAYAALSFPALGVDDNDSKFLDFDNDGDLDLIIASLGSTERVYTNDGTGGFTLTSGMITAVADASLDVDVADLTGDGRLDVVTSQGESGSFQNRIFINATGPVDTRAPKVIRTEPHADTSDTTGPYVVRAVVYDDVTSDRGFLDRGVSLVYTVTPAGPSPLTVAMDWSGNALWRGVIPGTGPCGGVIEYHIEARDFAGNLGTGPTESFIVAGVPLPGDINGDCRVDVTDLLALLSAWGRCGAGPITCAADLNRDGLVDVTDLLLMLANWSR
jgi:hypothetical protein